jgi:hypothetical protein
VRSARLNWTLRFEPASNVFQFSRAPPTIRPRFGPGPKTAVIAGIGVWAPASLLAMIAPAALHLFRYRLIAIHVALGFVEIVVGTVVGAWLYKGPEVPSGASAAQQ